MSRRYLHIPEPPLRLVAGVVLVWAFCLCFVDWGAQVVAQHPFAIVHPLEACDPWRTPTPRDVAAQIAAGEIVQVRSVERYTGELCLRVSRVDGTLGWVPYNPSFVGPAGHYIAWRRWR